MDPIKVAIIGLDTSHSVALPQLMQDPETKEPVKELKATRCLRFPTPFQSEEGQDKRQEYLESIGVMVTRDFDEAVADCDAIMLEINDPAFHLEYFEKCAKLGKPIFLDKPFADTIENARKILQIAQENNVRFFTASSLRFDIDIVEGLAGAEKPASATVWGPVGRAPAGSSIIWYGVHTFEILNRVLGSGATAVSGSADRDGYVFHVIYADGRRGVVEIARNCWNYGTVFRGNNDSKTNMICVTGRVPFYKMLLLEIVKFFKGEMPVPMEDSIEIMAMLSAAEESIQTGRTVPVYKF